MVRVALVTGAARGIGAATVAALAADGWRVVAAAGQAVAVEADVRDPEALAAAVRQAEERWGGLDAAVATAGVIAGGVPAWQVPAGQEQAVLDVDLGGVLNLARVAVPALLRRPEPRRGRFLAVASAAATSAGDTSRPSGCWAAKAPAVGRPESRALSSRIGVSVEPGLTALAVTPVPPSSAASARTNPATPAFAAQ